MRNNLCNVLVGKITTLSILICYWIRNENIVLNPVQDDEYIFGHK